MPHKSKSPGEAFINPWMFFAYSIRGFCEFVQTRLLSVHFAGGHVIAFLRLPSLYHFKLLSLILMNISFQTRLLCLQAAFVGSLVMSAILASKIIQIGPFIAPAGVFPFALTFLVTDIIAEVEGDAKARSLAGVGLVALVLCMAWVQLAIVLPAASFWKQQAAFATLLETGFRVALASIAAYVVSQWTDIWLFDRIRQLSTGRMLWLRNTLSTICSQFLDSSVFITLAFVGKFPVLPLVLGQWVLKVCIALLDTPLVYAGVMWLRWKK